MNCIYFLKNLMAKISNKKTGTKKVVVKKTPSVVKALNTPKKTSWL